MRTTITQSENGRWVTITYKNKHDDIVTRTFVVASDGGYVREVGDNHTYTQVCKKLSTHGETLYLATGSRLIDLIRREYRVMRKSMRNY